MKATGKGGETVKRGCNETTTVEKVINGGKKK